MGEDEDYFLGSWQAKCDAYFYGTEFVGGCVYSVGRYKRDPTGLQGVFIEVYPLGPCIFMGVSFLEAYFEKRI